MSARKCLSPFRALPPPVSMAAFTAAGFSSGLLLGASASIRLVSTKPTRSESASSRPASATTPSAVCAAARYACIVRRSSGLPAHPGSANRRSRRDGSTCERAHGDAGQFAEQLAPPPGDQSRPGGQRSGQAQAGAARVHPAQHARGRVGEQQVQGRRRGIGRGWPVGVGVGAHYQPSVGRGARSSIGRASRTRDRAWFRGHRTSPWGVIVRARRGAGDQGNPVILTISPGWLEAVVLSP